MMSVIHSTTEKPLGIASIVHLTNASSFSLVMYIVQFMKQSLAYMASLNIKYLVTVYDCLFLHKSRLGYISSVTAQLYGRRESC